jgi:peroxiredoxin
MAVSSTMLELGTKAPDFSLPDTVSDDTVNLGDFTQDALLVIFMSNHCPYVKHVQQGLAALRRDYDEGDVAIVGISANDVENYPDDSPAELARIAKEMGYGFPVLYDESQEVAKAYTAACTPDFFLFDADRALVYRGQMDSSRPKSGEPVTGDDLRAALDALLAGEEIPAEQRPSIGCSIKWKEGNAPAYAS